MTFITFIYRITGEPNTYYGKYCSDYISDDHNGLDTEVMYTLLNALNSHTKLLEKITESEISIGVLSFSSSHYIPTYSSDNEIKCFDFYRSYDKNIYINGILIEK